MDKIFWRIVTNNCNCYVLNKYMIHSQYCFHLFHPNKQELFFPACKYGKLDVIKILLQHVDPIANNNYAIQMASRFGHLEVVKLLKEYGCEL